MERIAIIADDLTGALDTGLQFARKSLRSAVVLHIDRFRETIAHTEAVAIDTDSRATSPTEAYVRARAAARQVSEIDFAYVYKKVDSTLRGNLGPEIDGILDEIAFDLVVVAPAFPRMGRTTVGGRQLLKGLPLEETEVALDPKCPVRESHIERLLAAQTTRPTGHIGLRLLRMGADMVVEATKAYLADGVKIVVFDAEEEEDLLRIAEAMGRSSYRILWVGSAGLADYLPQVLGLTGAKADREETSVIATGDPIMLVAGSISPTTRRQVEVVRQLPNLVTVELDPLRIMDEEAMASAEMDRCRAILSQALVAGKDVALLSGSTPEQVATAQDLGSRFGLDAAAVSNRIAAALGETVVRVIGGHSLQGLILTGGDTAKAVCRTLGVSGLEVVAEVECGVPLSRTIGSHRVLVATKAGAFGTDQTLARALRVMKGDL